MIFQGLCLTILMVYELRYNNVVLDCGEQERAPLGLEDKK